MVRLDTTATHTPISSTNSAGSLDTSKVKHWGGASASPILGASDAASVSTAGGIVAQATAGSDVRTAKVAALQAAIASGTYNVSAGDVADKMMQSLLEG